MTTTLTPLPYVRDDSEDGTLQSQTEINWVTNGSTLFGSSPESEPNYGTLNQVGTSLQENIVTCDNNINTVYTEMTTLQTSVNTIIQGNDENHLLKTIPPSFTTNITKYINVNEGDIPTLEVQGNNFDTTVWLYDNTPLVLDDIKSENLNTYFASGSTAASEGIYQVNLYNQAGGISSNECFLHVIPTTFTEIPTITKNLESSIIVKELTTLELRCDGSNYETITWKFNGYPIDNENTNILTISPALTANNGVYSAVFTNTEGSVESVFCTVTVTPNKQVAPVVMGQPLNRSVFENQSTYFVTSGQNYDYIAWELNGVEVPNVRGGILTIDDAKSSQEGWYRAKFVNDVATVYSQYVYLTVKPASDYELPYITQDIGQDLGPQLLITLTVGDPLTFTANAEAYVGLIWSKDATVVNTTSETFSIQNVETSDQGQYKCLFYNGLGYVQTTIVTVIVTY